MVASGFVQSLEFLKKSWNLPNNFPDLEKVWKIEIKSGKNGKKPWVFFSKLQQVLKWFFFFVLVKPYVCSAPRRKLCSAFLKVSIDHLFDNREYGKNYCLEKVLNFGSKVLKEPCAFKSSRMALRNRSMGPTTMFVKRLLFNSVLIYS